MKIHDSGDGNFPAELSGTYTLHPELNTISMGVDGEGDTEYILPPTTEWLVTEIYDVEGVVGDIGITAFSDVTTDVVTDIEIIRQAAILLYTTFEIITTHYKGNDLCDIYKGSESYAHVLRSINVDYTPPLVSWKITDTVLAPWVLIELYSIDWVYDNTNIATEFLTLTDMITTNDELEATTDLGLGIAEEVLALSSGGDITKVIDIVADAELTNISDSEPISSEITTPDMTGYTTPSGIVTTNKDDPDDEAWRAFDRNILNTGDWYSGVAGPWWVVYEFPVATALNQIDLIASDGGREHSMPRDWTLEGSNNGVDWDLLLTISSSVSWVAFERRSYPIPNAPFSYSYLRVNITNSDQARMYLGEIEFIAYTGDPDLLITTSPIKDEDNLVIVKDDDSTHDVVATGVTVEASAIVDATVIHTDVTSSTGTVSQSSYYNDSITFIGWKAFNLVDDGSHWISKTPTNEWLKYEFVAPIYLAEVILYSASNEGPKDMLYEISDDGVEWETIRTFTGINTTGPQTYILPELKLATFFRVSVLNSYSASYIAIDSLVLRKAESVQYTLDTTATTAGEAPTRVFKTPELTVITDIASDILIQTTSTYVVNTTLTCSLGYDDLYTVSNSVQLSVALFQSDKLTYFYGKVYQEDLSIPDQEVIYDASNIATEFIV